MYRYKKVQFRGEVVESGVFLRISNFQDKNKIILIYKQDIFVVFQLLLTTEPPKAQNIESTLLCHSASSMAPWLKKLKLRHYRKFVIALLLYF